MSPNEEEEHFPLADAFNEAVNKQYPDDRVPVGEVLHAASAIAVAYLDAIPDEEEKNAEVECFVSVVRDAVYPDGQPEVCLGCALSDAFSRKYPEGRTKSSDKDMLDVLSRMSAQFLEGASERGLETFFALVRSHREARRDEDVSAGPISHLTH